VKRLFAIFILTPAEQRLIIFVVLLLVAVAWYKHHRELQCAAAFGACRDATDLAFA
jgi:hypothetical protein